jgi:hypothetical protein
MFDFTTHIIFVASLIVMVYLLARALPRVADDTGSVPASAFDKLVEKLPLERIDRGLISVFEGMLRKIKILVSKIDNRINRNLDNLRHHSPALKQKQAQALKEKMEHMASSEEEQ